MAPAPGNDPKTASNSGNKNMLRVVVPALGIAAIIVLVTVIAGISDGGRKMSDGSNGSVDDPDLKELAPGVQYRDLKAGDGDECVRDSTVKVIYTGWLSDGTVFDSNKEKNEPAVFDLKDMIDGWKSGVPGMKVGGIRKLVISSEKGYRSIPKPKIPAGSTLIFEIQLLGASAPRARRSPAPDLTKLLDGSSPSAPDSYLKPVPGEIGLLYRDLKVGDGEVVKDGAVAVVDYTGWLLSNGKMFDSSWKPNRSPLSANLSPSAQMGGVISGWQKGVPGMKVGGIRKLVIPAALAYKDQAMSDIPPNSDLVFEIEVLHAK